MKENPRLIYAIGSRQTRAFSPRQLPTDHDYAVPTREYQTDQSSQKLPRPLLALPSNNFNNSKIHECHKKTGPLTGKALDIAVQQIAWAGVFVAQDGWRGIQVPPAAEMDAAQDAANGGRTEAGGASDLIAGCVLAAQQVPHLRAESFAAISWEATPSTPPALALNL
jgi:hypothetical protein